MTIGFGEEFLFHLSSDYPNQFKPHHWEYPESNSVIHINGIEIDVFQWQLATDNRKSVKVNLVWEPKWDKKFMSEDAKLTLDIF